MHRNDPPRALIVPEHRLQTFVEEGEHPEKTLLIISGRDLMIDVCLFRPFNASWPI